jgi:hypothetical protein
MTGYCPNCGLPVEHDGRRAKCEHCSIEWSGMDTADGVVMPGLKPEPYAPGELEAIHAEAQRAFDDRYRNSPGIAT